MQSLYKIGLAYIRNNSLLLCRPFAFDLLIMPGGILQPNENVIDNLIRQVAEELGESAKLDTSSLKYLGNFSDVAAGKTERTVEIELYLGSVNGNLKASSEIKELVWFSPEDDWEQLSLIVKNKIFPFLLESGFLSFPPTEISP
jgi:8-oxo-dGTP pyrophosphatase MutT (NUDIX family)